MEERETLLAHLDKIHTTRMGAGRIRKNLGLTVDDVVLWCKEQVSSADCKVTRRGKNWYAQGERCVLTINAGSYTIITAHKGEK